MPEPKLRKPSNSQGLAQCEWCGEVLHDVAITDSDWDDYSHAICTCCAEKVLEFLENS